MASFKTFKNSKGDILEVNYTDWCENPFDDSEACFMKMYTWGNYSSIHNNEFSSPEEFVDSILGEGKYDKIKTTSLEKGLGIVNFVKEICKKIDRKGIFAVPILKYEHGQVSYYIGESIDRFDGSVAGFAWEYKERLLNNLSRKSFKKLTPKAKKIILKDLENCLAIYTNYANGDVFEYTFTDSETGEVDSCTGFIPVDPCDDNEILQMIYDYLPTDDHSFKEVSLEDEEVA